MMEIRIVGVVGCGQMGSGIAQLAAVNGLEIWLHDSDWAALSKAHKSISSRIQSMISKGQLDKGKGAEALRNLNFTTNLEDFRSVDIVIEAIVESEEVKRELFARLDKMVKSSAILASNTSSIPITRLGSATSRPAQVIGMHFMNPPPVMKLVEIIRGVNTSDDTFNATKLLAERLGKKIVCSHDFPGFIVNRILMPMINEAFHALYTGVATKEDIDAGMKFGTNHPMGPLELADHIGLDVCLSIMKVLQMGLGDSKYSPCPLLVQYVDAGRLVFKYKKGSDSVLVVNKDDYDHCKTTNPIKKFDGGRSIFRFSRSGPFFFISGNEANCSRGQRLIVVVLAVRSGGPGPSPVEPPAPRPGFPPAEPPSPAPAPADFPPENYTPVVHPPRRSFAAAEELGLSAALVGAVSIVLNVWLAV
ncbi:fatty acid oxidation complex subunit alpha [Striga asiatica]|uniref:Fatty acid oxidation complex subunit alpha n=1 Tax=Striga asiatica TaxID=4170 RepID=A0A5A7R8U0_STRAF|nr:fatty acid oxidation complex subunit alpha [Striga asiatica]